MSAFPNSAKVSFTPQEGAYVQKFQDFLDNSPDPFHVVNNVKNQLNLEGFTQLSESEAWKAQILQKRGKYYFTRNGSSVVAFTIGGNYKIGNGWKILGAHTDSPNLKIKPNSKRLDAGGKMKQLNVECYGGGLWHTWFDRDLSLSGRVILRDPATGRFSHRLLKIAAPILRIPNLCIHLQSGEEREAFRVNKENHLQPILCDVVINALTTGETSGETSNDSNNAWKQGQEPLLLQLIAKELNVAVDSIADFELNLYDTQPASRSGLFQEYLCSSRLDNLGSCYVLLESFLEHSRGLTHEVDEGVTVLALFDHEEVGSASYSGAGSSLIQDTIERLHQVLLHNFKEETTIAEEAEQIAKAKSFILSVDMAHAVHPNYASKHDRSHSPLMNHGLVIKSNSNQRYATNGLTGFVIRELARSAGTTIQEFTVRNDCPCGSTIGPILSTNTGIRAVDLGMPQLSMHSIREMMGCADLISARDFFLTFLRRFHEVDQHIAVDSK